MRLLSPDPDRFPETDSGKGERPSLVVTGVALLAALAALAAIAGRLFGIDVLTSPLPALRAISLSSALAALLIALGITLAACMHRRSAMLITALAALLVLVDGLRIGGILTWDGALPISGLRFEPMSAVGASIHALLACALLLFLGSRRAGLQALGAAAVVSLVISLGALAYYVHWLPLAGREPVLLSVPVYTVGLHVLLGLALAALFFARGFGRRPVALSIPMRVGTALTVIGLSSAWTVIVWKDDASLRTYAKQSNANLVRVLEEHLYRSMDPVNLLLRGIEAKIERRGLENVSDSTEDWQQVQEAASALPQLLSIVILDAEGDLRFISSQTRPKATNFAFRDYFQAHRAGQEIYLGQLIRSGLNRLVFSYSRRLEDAQGNFVGVVVAGLDIDYFVSFYSGLNLEGDSSLLLARSDGKPLVRAPTVPNLLDMDFSALEPFSAAARSQKTGTAVGRSMVDGSTRLAAYRHSGTLPVVVIATQNVDDMIARFEERFLISGLILAAALGLVIAAAYQQAAAAGQEARARALLERSNLFVQSVTNSVAAALAILDRDGRIVSVNAGWRAFAESNGAAGTDGFLGANYLAVCRTATGDDELDAHRAGEGIAAVQQGRLEVYEQIYPCHSATQRRWFKMRVTPLLGAAGQVVVSHENITDLKEALEALRTREARLQQITQEVPAVLYEWYVRGDGSSGFHYLSPRLENLFGVDPAQVLQDWRSLPIHPEDAPRFLSSVEAAVANRSREWLFEGRVVCPDGRVCWTRSHSTLTAQDNNELVYTGVMVDVTEEKTRTDALAESEKRLNLVAANIPALVAYIDADERFRFANAAYEEWYGTDPQSLIGKRVEEVADAEQYRSIVRYLRIALGGERVAFERQDVVRGKTRYFWATYIPDRRGDQVDGIYTFVTDITAQKELELYLTQQAMFDSLTGLPNRSAIHDQIERGVDRCQRSGQPMAVLFLDLDRFKQVNDTLGHDAGDELLRIVALRLREAVRKTDTVARLAGDEFVILLEGLNGGEADAQRIADKLLQVLAHPALINGESVSIHASVGIAMHAGGETSAAELLKKSDRAMYRAKGRRGMMAET